MFRLKERLSRLGPLINRFIPDSGETASIGARAFGARVSGSKGAGAMALSDGDVAAFRDFETQGWEKAADPYHRLWGALSVQSASAVMDAVGAAPGTSVLDVATGAGYLAAEAARRGSIVMGADISTNQVALARRNLPELEFRVAAAEQLPWGDEMFDAVVIGFGMNHLPAPEEAAEEAFRVLKPGGTFAFTVWSAPKPGEAFGIVFSALERHGRENVDLPPAPPYFRFADAREVSSLLEGAGFTACQTREVPQFWRHQSPDSVFDAFHEGAVRVTALLRAQPEDAKQAIRAAVRAEVETHRQGHEYVTPAPATLSWARKPADR